MDLGLILSGDDLFKILGWLVGRAFAGIGKQGA
jgi:hypothetical protein